MNETLLLFLDSCPSRNYSHSKLSWYRCGQSAVLTSHRLNGAFHGHPGWTSCVIRQAKAQWNSLFLKRSTLLTCWSSIFAGIWAAPTPTAGKTSNNVTNYFYRFEFQKRGTLHTHILIRLQDMNEVDVTKLSATIPWGNVEEVFQVYDLQKSSSCALPLRQGPNQVLTENGETYLAFHHMASERFPLLPPDYGTSSLWNSSLFWC